MNRNLINYITNHTICVLTTLLPDGSPHSATMNYVYDEQNGSFYYISDRNDTKCQLLITGETSPASLVIGFEPHVWTTLQMRGELSALENETADFIVKTHFEEDKDLASLLKNDDRIVLEFKPDWWRFTDQASATIYTSDSENDKSGQN